MNKKNYLAFFAYMLCFYSNVKPSYDYHDDYTVVAKRENSDFVFLDVPDIVTKIPVITMNDDNGVLFYDSCGDKDSNIEVWDTVNERKIDSFRKSLSLAFSADYRKAISVDAHGFITVWNLCEGFNSYLADQKVWTGDTQTVKMSPNGELALTSKKSSSASILNQYCDCTLWTTNQMQALFTIENIKSIEFSPDSRSLLLVDKFGTAFLFNIMQNKFIKSYSTGSDDVLSSASFSPCGKFVVGKTDKTHIYWKIGTEAPIYTCEPDKYLNIQFVNQNHYIVTTYDNVMFLFDILNGKRAYSGLHTDVICDVAVDKNGTNMVLCDNKNRVVLFRINSQKCLVNVQKIHTFLLDDIIISVSFSLDGSKIIILLNGGKVVIVPVNPTNHDYY